MFTSDLLIVSRNCDAEVAGRIVCYNLNMVIWYNRSRYSSES
jgi:hypothetical protein